ncbi:hypothetical protein FRC11_011232 [Ceratobasidium sp. 423]|nr:hypothetical protein FRC11_011232 [Ceratobasidium sp. 423]
MKRLIKERPPLKRIRVNVRMKDPEKTIQRFSSFSSLQIIEIDSDDRDVGHLVKVASDILRNCTQKRDGKEWQVPIEAAPIRLIQASHPIQECVAYNTTMNAK